MPDSVNALPRPRRVLIIGGGPNGLVTLRNLVERGNFDRVELVERRDDVGGIWYLDNPDLETTGIFDPKPRWPSPAYPGLIGNLTPSFLSFSGAPFPPPPSTPHQPFPNVSETYQYLRSFATPYINKGLIRLNTEVTRVEELADGNGWKVESRSWHGSDAGRFSEEIWDAIVVCVGWFDHPVWPDTEGLNNLKKRGIAMHAKSWGGPAGFEDKRVIVVGNAHSGNDMTMQMAAVAKPPLYHSIRRPALPDFPSLPDPRVVDVPPVKRYTLRSVTSISGDDELGDTQEKVTVVLEDGTEINDIDVVLLGTGYRPNPGFIYVLPPPSPTPTADRSSESRNTSLGPVPLMSLLPSNSSHQNRVPYLHRHILYAYNPMLAFIGPEITSNPFTIADLASTWLALAWQDLIQYPDTSQGRLEFETRRIAELEERSRSPDEITDDTNAGPRKGRGSALGGYHVLSGSEEEDFMRELWEDVVKVNPELRKVLAEWNEEKKRERADLFAAKLRALQWERDSKLKLKAV
ncbi:hypothetical protein GYMLUDRAFT_702019 [Collybiopsis luxurians FD-317 M1]|uniref:FAD/NAD(P)-binding domain-containing protein n=1 Tax=Collybiopsis luxurians FD-317 M1 TaxID=944289 RepID=A0A0D0BSF6_9AGAR|nr:hypothetical protein GYMLUDRAFT_702019 [Collybiopsis luxurians FD-317 M1]